MKGAYAKAEELPNPSKEVSRVTDIWLKLEGVPAKYDRMLLQVDLYRQDGNGWTSYRVATSHRPVFGKGNLWQHSLSLTGPRDSEWARELANGELPVGKYLVKISVDQAGKLQRDFTTEMNDEDWVGQVVVESRWPPGYGSMTVVGFPQN